MEKMIILSYINWHFIEAVKDIFLAWRNFLVFGLEYFSVPTLVRTFFSHWHRYYYSYGDKWNPQRWIEAFTFNSMSRIIGAMLRVVLIFTGILFEFLIIFLGLIVILFWITAPIIVVVLFLTGLGLLF
jgi:hypothetical protein